VPTEPFEAKTVVAKLEPYYRTDEQVSRMLTLAAVLAVLIGCIGLYGLASFNTAQRVREIGIRKTLGASTHDILRLLMGQFLRPVVLANLAAWPLAYIALRAYLLGFDQRVALTPAYFLIASVTTLAIAAVTVAGQALFVARAPPAKALRHE
jgi:putative ABC transport system permease protein